MIKSTRGQIIIFLVIYVLIITIGFILLNKTDRDKIDLVISELTNEKSLQLRKTIEFKSKALNAYTFDYTYWDEMVDFIQNRDLQWAKENIDVSLSTYEADYVWVYSPDLTLVYSYSSPGYEVIEMLPFDPKTLSRLTSSGGTYHFYENINSGIVEISGASVHPSSDLDRESKPLGYFFAGRKWDEQYLSEVGLFTGSKIFIDLPDINGQFNAEKSLDKYGIKSSFILNNWDGNVLANITSVYDFKIGESVDVRASNRFVLVMVVFSILIVVYILFMVLRVFHPLGLIARSLRDSNPEYLKKLFLRKDEFGRLSKLISDFFRQKDQLVEEISQRNEIEVLLRKLVQAIEQSPATIIITNTEGKIEYVNPKFTELTGYNLSEVIGKNPRFLRTGKKAVSENLELWHAIHSGKEWRGEFSNKKKNGEIYYESVIISPIFDEKGEIINFLAVNEDITKKKRNEKIRNVIHKIAQAGTSSVDLGDLIERIHILMKELIDVTNYYLALYDIKTDTFFLPHFKDQKDSISHFKSGKTLTAYLFKSQRSLLLKEMDIERLKQTGVVSSIGENAKVWLGVPLKIENDVIGVFVVQSYDNENAYTEEDKEMLEFISYEMSHVIQKMKSDDDLKAALEQAELSDKLKSAFLANISHEIRTPLNSILGFSKLVVDEEISYEKRKEFSSMIKGSGEQLLSIINNLLDFSLIETGQFKLVSKEFDVDKLLKELRKEYHHCAVDRGLEMKVSGNINNEPSIVYSDISRVRQVLRNLINNSVKFTKEGSIEIGHFSNEDGVVIYVKDTGIGISDDFRSQIFKSFTQADKAKSRKFSGNGLGLALSKKIIEKMGGKIWFESEEGKGSVFYILFPE